MKLTGICPFRQAATAGFADGDDLAASPQGPGRYSQVPRFGSVFVGKPYQFPLLLESLSTTLPFVAVSLLWWRDDSGLTGAERLANRFTITRKSGRAGVLAVMIIFMNVGYFAYLAPFFVVRHFELSTEVARPWRCRATKVYDPHSRFYLTMPSPGVCKRMS